MKVFIRKNDQSGDVILSRKPGDWAEFFEMVRSVENSADFVTERDQGAADDRDPFARAHPR